MADYVCGLKVPSESLQFTHGMNIEYTQNPGIL